MAKPATRIAFLQGVLGLGAVVVLGRAFQLQVTQHAAWRARADLRDVRVRDVSARRGSLLDQDGVPLAVTFEAYHLTLARDQMTDVDAIRRLLHDDLDLSPAQVNRAFGSKVPYFDGPFSAAAVSRIRRLAGVHVEAVPRRSYPMGAVANRYLGRTDREAGRGTEGFEASLDVLLRGTPGKERFLRDGAGNPVPIPGGVFVTPHPGQDVVLTIDHELQAIAEEVLRSATVEQQAMGGDVVILDVATGDVLAIASRRTPSPGGASVATSSAIVEPMEPGSTAKIFTAAALLVSHADTTPQSGEDGVWEMPIGTGRTRTIRDVHREPGLLTLGRTIAVSSNIAISKFSQHITADAQYRTLRNFGFGTSLATGFPGEADGVLRRPSDNPNLIMTQASWGQGYELMASSLQIAAAYAAIANGGYFVAPAFVREVRDGQSGAVVWRHRPDTLRRVLDAEVAARLMEYLQMTTDSGGTGKAAQLDLIDVIGKTGTAKIPDERGNYTSQYRASFAAIFPGHAPRFVVYVMIDRPSAGEIYGGTVAAPLVRTLVQQGLALDDSPLKVGPQTTATARAPDPVAPRPDVSVQRVPFPDLDDSVATVPLVHVPDVRGWSVRDGVFALHRRGLVVRLDGFGTIDRLTPVAGDSVPSGSTITVHAGGTR
jgi:cell division protein FtsI (penicillin-binding protein 3)